MKTLFLPLLFCIAVGLSSCRDEFNDELQDDINEEPKDPFEESTTAVTGQAVLKVLPHPAGWVVFTETLQPQLMVTQPKREISWMNASFSETSKYMPSDGWSLIDAVVHPSGDVSAVSVKIVMGNADYELKVKMTRIKNGGSIKETEITQLPNTGEPMPTFPGSIDRVKLVAYGEDVYVVARWRYNEIQAHRLSFEDDQFKTDWQKWVEPPHYVGFIGIIGGGYDNFRQGDRYYFVYGDVDSEGNLYVAAPSHEEMLFDHDQYFGENLSADADPGGYNFGVAVLTKFSSNGERIYAKLAGLSRQQRLINMRVTNEGVYFTGRVKVNQQPNGWDAWILAKDLNGNTKYESTVDVRDGDMFWDVNPLPGGGVVAVGTTDYTQNPAGLSVSDARKAAAFILDNQGKVVKEIELPQGPAERGSEAMYVGVSSNGSVVFAGAHNAPGTHAAVYSDGFIAVRDFSPEP